MHVGFLPFVPKPVAEYSTIYTSKLNFVKVSNRLDQEALPLFCDEGVFRIVLDIYLQKKDEFCNIIPMLGGLNIASGSISKDLGKRKASDRHRYLMLMLTLMFIVKDLGAADREGNWEGHLKVIQRLRPFFQCQVALIIYDMDLGTWRKWEKISMNTQKCTNISKREICSESKCKIL